MGFRRSDYFDPPNPVDFTDPITGVVDWSQFVEDLIGRLLTDHRGFVSGITTEQLAQLYFGRTDFEACTAMQQAMQRARALLFGHGIFLKNTSYRWHIAEGPAEKMEYLKNRTRRLMALFRRTQTQLAIAAEQHQEIAEHPMVAAFAAAAGGLPALEEAERIPLPGGASGGSND